MSFPNQTNSVQLAWLKLFGQNQTYFLVMSRTYLHSSLENLWVAHISFLKQSWMTIQKSKKNQLVTTTSRSNHKFLVLGTISFLQTTQTSQTTQISQTTHNTQTSQPSQTSQTSQTSHIKQFKQFKQWQLSNSKKNSVKNTFTQNHFTAAGHCWTGHFLWCQGLTNIFH